MHLHPTFCPTTFPPGCSADTSVSLERNIGKDFRRPLARSHKQGLSWFFHRKIPISKSKEEHWEDQKGHKRPILSPIQPSLSRQAYPSHSAPLTISDPNRQCHPGIPQEPSPSQSPSFQSFSFQTDALPPSPIISNSPRKLHVCSSLQTPSTLCRSPRTKVRRKNRMSIVPSSRRTNDQPLEHRREGSINSVERAIWRTVEARKNVVLTIARDSSGKGRRDSLRASVKGV